jgi:hypothetical protein
LTSAARVCGRGYLQGEMRVIFDKDAQPAASRFQSPSKNRKDFLVGYFVVPGDGIADHKAVTMAAVPKEAKRNPNFEAYRKAWKEYLDLIQLEDESPCGRTQRSYEGFEEWIPGPYAASEGRLPPLPSLVLTRMGVA